MNDLHHHQMSKIMQINSLSQENQVIRVIQLEEVEEGCV